MTYEREIVALKVFGPNDAVELDGKSFVGCSFRKAMPTYSGGPPPEFDGDTEFHETTISPRGPAANSIRFLRSLWKDGDWHAKKWVLQMATGDEKLAERIATLLEGEPN